MVIFFVGQKAHWVLMLKYSCQMKSAEFTSSLFNYDINGEYWLRKCDEFSWNMKIYLASMHSKRQRIGICSYGCYPNWMIRHSLKLKTRLSFGIETHSSANILRSSVSCKGSLIGSYMVVHAKRWLDLF